MNYQALARKWRPQIFSDVIGQEHILTVIKNSLSLNRVHHSYLLSGTRGVGKTTIARLLAKGLNCKSGVTSTPCRDCTNCKEIEKGCFVDLIEVDAASRTKVEEIRELLENVPYAPSNGNFKVYLIDEAHMLSRYSFNALLKNLEEPPKHVKFLLATTEPKKLPITILSRCLQFHLKLLNVKQIYKRLSFILKQEKIITDSYALQLLARAANGSMRDALSLTDQAIAMGNGKINYHTTRLALGSIDDEHPLDLIEALANANGKEIIKKISQFADCDINWDNLLIEILSLLHQLTLGQLFPEQLINEDMSNRAKRLSNLTERFSSKDLHLYYQSILTGRKVLQFAPNPRVGVEMILLRALSVSSTLSKPNINNNNLLIINDEKQLY
ncbi:DNA polymerase III subunit gamma/tau [Sodalis sp. CWE]|nr:DNA polymerase III subunit gamma/tau [Sodalis sp. CWE]MBX4180918.1 DNA polymerase III subunit gamma/tau [Sodalis sp. CWE]